MKFRAKADKNSSLYFVKWSDGEYPQFIINNSPWWKSTAKTFDTWQDANEVARHFNGYIEEVQPEIYMVYWDSGKRKFIARQENRFITYENTIESNLTKQESINLVRSLNISYDFVMEHK